MLEVFLALNRGRRIGILFEIYQPVHAIFVRESVYDILFVFMNSAH